MIFYRILFSIVMMVCLYVNLIAKEKHLDILIINGKVVKVMDDHVVVKVPKQVCSKQIVKIYYNKPMKEDIDFEINKTYFFAVRENKCPKDGILHELKFKN